MCVPSAGIAAGSTTGSLFQNVMNGLNVASGVMGTISEYKTNKANAAYQTQIALNNAKIAQNEALRQKQLGIEKSRLEKISGMQEVNKQKALYAASNLDMMSQTSQMAYQDTLNMAQINADVAKKEYDIAANSYFNQANSYLNQAQSYKNQYNQSLFANSMNALGKFSQVASDWYSNKEKEGGSKIGIF